ncbi:MAG: Na+/H+ antiporter NhaA [Alphaproteobacteria bacterium]
MAAQSGIAKRPDGASWMQIYGVACLCGIGFTMSLFISNLAFTDPEYGSAIRLGVLSGSASMSVIGFLVLRFCPTTTGKQTA